MVSLSSEAKLYPPDLRGPGVHAGSNVAQVKAVARQRLCTQTRTACAGPHAVAIAIREWARFAAPALVVPGSAPSGARNSVVICSHGLTGEDVSHLERDVIRVPAKNRFKIEPLRWR
jgi:hypothetical protein